LRKQPVERNRFADEESEEEAEILRFG